MDGELGRASIGSIRTIQAASRNPFTPASDPVSQYAAEKDGIRLRLRVVAHPVNAADTINNEAVSQKQVDVYAAVETIMRDDLGTRGQATDGGGSPTFHDVDGDGKDELLFFTGDGLVHAYTDVAQGRELPGWPVHSLPLSTPGLHGPGSNADIPLKGTDLSAEEIGKLVGAKGSYVRQVRAGEAKIGRDKVKSRAPGDPDEKG